MTSEWSAARSPCRIGLLLRPYQSSASVLLRRGLVGSDPAMLTSANKTAIYSTHSAETVPMHGYDESDSSSKE